MKTPWKVATVALVVLAGCYMLRPGASEAGQPGQYKTAYGVMVYLGVKSARVMKAQPQTYPELHARGTIPRGRNDQYVSVALFESSSGERINFYSAAPNRLATMLNAWIIVEVGWG